MNEEECQRRRLAKEIMEMKGEERKECHSLMGWG